MPRDNVEIVQGFFEARNRGDLGCLDYIEADAEFDLSESRSPYHGIYRGHEQIRKHWETLREAWAEAEMHPEEPVAVGDHVVVTVRVSARGRSSGVQLQGFGANVYTLRDGKIVRFKLFQTRAEALKAVGLAD
ncbi:MAG TPA: nuclear transport factor 2 family protein [Solirubrobacteraceae bacterium]|nr:nuclear transport factor 2 family protein [Solirubrobacteraceae bacterium]